MSNLPKTGQQQWRPFEEARAYVHRRGLKNLREWRAWVKTTARPLDLPVHPERIYKNRGWISWGDWLGTNTISPQNRTYRPFAEAREFARSWGFKSSAAWWAWARTNARPSDIPNRPDKRYKDQGWVDWGDWLGTHTVAVQCRIYLPFTKARAHVQALGLKTESEWRAWSKTSDRPPDIPATPHTVYADCGWAGMSDWLGVVNRWSRNEILSFLRDLQPRLAGLSAMVLFEMLRQNGMLAAAARACNSNQQQLADIVKLTTAGDHVGLAERIASLLTPAGHDSTAPEPSGAPDEITQTIIPPHNGSASRDAVAVLDDGGLPAVDVPAVLAAVDYAALVCPGADEEALEFFVAEAVGALWRAHLRGEEGLDIAALRDYPAGPYATVVRERFLGQLEGAQALPIPAGYAFRDKAGQPVPPNLMQRLVAYRLKTERRLGNWSGTGAGKTMAAILASRVVDAHLTVVVALNNTLDGWKDEILNTFPSSMVIVKESGALTIARGAHIYLLLNFEAFQQPGSSSLVRRLVEDNRIDMIVLDEVHSAKQRDVTASKRRRVLGGLLTLAAEKNPDLYVLGMSATPVINNLFEAKSLLEMVQGVEFAELDTRHTIPNVVGLHQKLVIHGVRYRPHYSQELEERRLTVPGDALLAELRCVGKGDVLGIERVLLGGKLDALVAEIQPGTLIYTYYVDGIVEPLGVALETAGYRVAEFTGDDKSGLHRFVRGEVDVLIGSSTLGTGVDGLQRVCNRLIVATLPWTSAGYEQLIGRLYRQGSLFGHVDVIIPQVVLGTGDDTWSWDVQRHDRIRYKKTLADAAVDGVIPEGVLEAPEALLARSLEALHGWIARVEREGPAPTIERPRLSVPLPPDVMRTAWRSFGDFATMNARFNTARSTTTHDRLTNDPTEWYLYHTLYREARQGWPEVPYETYVDWLKAGPHLVVGDFGCGEALLAAAVPNKVYSFDHVAIHDGVIACDMAHTPLADGTLDVAIFSLSLMGTNVEDYLREAYRVLRLNGRLRIAEAASRWEGAKRDELLSMIGAAGFTLLGTVQERERFLYIDALKA